MSVCLEVLKRIIDDVPIRDNSKKKEPIPKTMKEEIISRDQVCRICNDNGEKIKLEVHHIIPNGPAIEYNLILLCVYCHEYVHNMLRRKNYSYPPNWRRAQGWY